jgi:outer membrane scaffolding protein for murein synthesis (MipA/OmpV family)
MIRKLALLLWCLSLPVFADHYPGHARIEWGLGIGALTQPDYRGSTHRQDRILPLPYFKYRGDRLRVDDGIEGRFFKKPDLLLTLSGNGSLPSSDDNPERAGMAKLDASVEIGPSLEYRIRYDDQTSLWLELPLRIALNVEDSLDSIGSVFHPRLAWRRPALTKFAWKLRVAGGPLYADENYHSYYYDVRADEVTATRPAFSAQDGFSGYRVDFTYSRRISKYWFGGFVRYDNLSGSEIEDSPLVTTTSNWTAGLGLSWIISER